MHYVIESLLETAKLLLLLTVVVAIPMCFPRSRHVLISVVKFTARKSPPWAGPAMVVCGLIPGQADELILAAILLIPIMRSAHNQRKIKRVPLAYAWFSSEAAWKTTSTTKRSGTRADTGPPKYQTQVESFANDITSRSKSESVELATETLREAMPFAKVNAFFVELSENQRGPQYPARIGLVFD